MITRVADDDPRNTFRSSNYFLSGFFALEMFCDCLAFSFLCDSAPARRSSTWLYSDNFLVQFLIRLFTFNVFRTFNKENLFLFSTQNGAKRAHFEFV